MPEYHINKKKINIGNSSPDIIIEKFKEMYKNEKINTDDGLRIDFENHWLHLRKSNTEPIIRIIVEAKSEEEAEKQAEKYLGEIHSLNK